MSTPGKVLSVLVILASIGWLVLASMATQRHRNWGEKIRKQDEQIAQLGGILGELDKPGELATLQEDLRKLREQIDAEQVQAYRDATVLRDKISSIENQLSETRESLSRLTILVKDSQIQVEEAKRIAEIRGQERTNVQKLIADNEQELGRLRDVDAQLRDRRDTLTREFQATLAENRQLVSKLRNAASRN